MIRDRRGFTLLEMLVAVSLLVPIAALAATLALHSARVAAVAGSLAATEGALADAAAILEAELAALDQGGLLGLSPTAVTFHAVRGSGAWCRLDSLGVVVPAAGAWAASRVPVPGRDSLELEAVDTAAGTRTSRRLGLVAPPSATTCPAGPPGLLLATTSPAASTAALGALLTTTEVVQLRGYSAGGSTWLGMDHLGTAGGIEPVAGPLATAGITFQGLRADGTPTAVPGEVRLLAARLVGGGRYPVARTIVVALRW